MKAVILGATGLTGNHLLQLLLDDKDFEKVTILTRKSVNINHPKLEERIIDLLDLSKHIELFKTDVVFCCIGTTKAKTPNMDLYRAIDYGIPVEAAKIAKQQNVSKFIVISALGANPNSRMYYSKFKGEMQRDVLAENIPETYFVQPSLIVGDRKENRKSEETAEKVMRVLDFIIPKKYKVIEAKDIAKSMQNLAKKKYEQNIITSDLIREIAQK